MTTRARHVAVAAAYLGLVVWVLGSVLPRAGESYPLGAAFPHSAVTDQDQSHFIWAASRNARVLLTAPWRLPAFEYCYPFPGAVALGHHMYASGVMAMVPYALTSDPILASNFVVLAMLWASAFGMYAFAFHLTRSVSAAFVAGALFGFQFSRVAGAHWPAMVGNEWTPLALLFLHRTFTRRRWGDALGLALFTGIQLLESFYQLLPLALYGSFVGLWLLVRHRTSLATLAPKLLAASAFIAVILAFVAIPYLDVRDTWGLLEGRASLTPLLNGFLPGNLRYPGTGLVVLAAIGVLDRFRRRRGDDPRLPILFAGILLLACIVRGVVLPGIGWVPSPGLFLIGVLPGLAAVRGLQFGVHGLWIAAAVLAAYGVLWLQERVRPSIRPALTTLVVVLGLGEALVPALAVRSFSAPATLVAVPFTVSRAVVDLLDERLPDAPILDVPSTTPPLAFGRRAHHVLLAAFHRRPTPACAASFVSPLRADVEALGSRLPDPAAAEALYAMGFRGVILHEEDYLSPAAAERAVQQLGTLEGDPRLVDVGEVDRHRLYRLESTKPARTDLEGLVTGATLAGPMNLQPAKRNVTAVAFRFRNLAAETYRHPDPIVPTAFTATWHAQAGPIVATEAVRAPLPPAVAAHDDFFRKIELTTPDTPGTYLVTLALADPPSPVVALARVEVTPEAAKPSRRRQRAAASP